jgi:anti-sigma28 factor (negative regulator of flagellin synthesis)
MNSLGKSQESQDLDPLLAAPPQTRADSIAQLRRAVESGTYSVSAEQIAETMLQEALLDWLTLDHMQRPRPR